MVDPSIVERQDAQETTHLSIDDLANWLAKPEIKNNPTITIKKLPKTDAEWFDLMGKSTSKKQKKTKISQPKEDHEAGHSVIEQQDA